MSWIHQSYLPEVQESAPARKTPGQLRRDARNRAIIAKAADMTVPELAREFSVSIPLVYSILAGVKAKGASSNLPQTDRNAHWCDLYRAGQNATQIADQFGVTRERVCQILRMENLIEHKAQRIRLARELIEQDRAVVLAEKAAIDQKVAEAVQGGASCADAAAMYGITTPQATYICQRRGIKSQHGRWRDFSERSLRIKALIEAGHSAGEALRIRGDEEGRKIGYSWFQRHHPELCEMRRRRRIVAPPIEAKPPKLPAPRKSPAPVYDVEAEWSPERTSELVKLWLGGTSAQQIVDIFGAPFTRNSILGKVHRLRLAGQLKMSPAE